MNRQKLTVTVIIGIFLLLLGIRAFSGHGLGRIYVERGSASFVKVDVPKLGSDGSDVQSTWVTSTSDEAIDFAEPTSERIEWTAVTPVPPRVYFEANLSNEALEAALSSPVPKGISESGLEAALADWQAKILAVAATSLDGRATPVVVIDWAALRTAGYRRDTVVSAQTGGDFRKTLDAILKAGRTDAIVDPATTVVVSDGRLAVTTPGATPTTSIGLSWPRTIGLWLAAIFTLAIFSFLYKDNALYKLAESTVVGVSAGYWMVIGLWDMIVPNLFGKLLPGFVQGNLMPGLSADGTNWAYLVPLIFGLLLLMRLAPKGQFFSLWTLAFIVGTTAALRMVAYIEGDFLSQINATVAPLYQQVVNADGSVNGYSSFWASVRQITLVIGVLACLTYFFFSVEHKGAVGKVARVGIWFLMITFGAAFGFTVMGRIALLAARFEFLFDDWLWLIDPTNQRTVAAAVGCLL